MAELQIDELNINQPFKNRSEPYEQYFGIMNISKRQKRERVLLAMELEDIFFEFLLLMEILHNHGLGYEQAQEQLKTQYRDKMFEVLPEYDGDFIRVYAAAYAVNAVDTTAKHIANLDTPIDVDGKDKRKIKRAVREIQQEILNDIPLPDITVVSSPEAENQPEENQTDNWYISLDRAKFNAENEANTVLNRSDFLKAKEAGYKRKRWMTERDNKVRPTHQEVEGITIPIEQLFVVGNSLMAYPKDMTYNPEIKEILNCRCGILYLK